MIVWIDLPMSQSVDVDLSHWRVGEGSVTGPDAEVLGRVVAVAVVDPLPGTGNASTLRVMVEID